jgi:MoaA/NifB/PqqE/SkfB family radical SAM enzyme
LADIGFDGPREIFRRVRRDYDTVTAGVTAFQNAGVPISFSAVVLRSTLHGLPHLLQIADVVGAGKVKLILLLRKGNALNLADHEFVTVVEAREHFGRLDELRTVHGWEARDPDDAVDPGDGGHMIVIEPDGAANAWAVYDQLDLIQRLGNIYDELVTAMWERHPDKAQHYAKYLGRHTERSARAIAMSTGLQEQAWRSPRARSSSPHSGG